MAYKRKRSISTSISNSGGDIFEQAINPLSYAPSTLVQLGVAGLSDKDELPSDSVPGFPHRPLPINKSTRDGKHSPLFTLEYETGDEEQGEESVLRRDKQKPRVSELPGGHLGALIYAMRQFIEQGNIDRAARAFGLIANRKAIGATADLRHHDLWAMGLEIIMREGEKPLNLGDRTESRRDGDATGEDGKAPTHLRPRHWGSKKNLQKARAYLTALIHKHPYDYRQPRRIAAPDFWFALLNCEMRVAQSEYTSAISKIQRPGTESVGRDGDDDDDDEDEEEEDGDMTQQERKDSRSDEVRLRTLADVKGTARQIDDLFREQAYIKNARFRRLRAMASLFIADLSVPFSQPGEEALEQHLEAAKREQDNARGELEMMMEYGGELDAITRKVLGRDEGFEYDPAIGSLYSSLPIREAT